MDLKRIFIKDACPTKAGGQAVIEGIMMKGPEKNAIVVRVPDGRMHIKVEENPKRSKLAKVPFIRGVFVFIGSLVQGTKTLLYSADVLEAHEPLEEEEEPGKFYKYLESKLGERGMWNLLLYSSVVFALLFTVGVFILAPTAVVSLCKHFTHNVVVLNLIEGVLRIILFILYLLVVSKLEDMRRVFQYHGAEHKTIHCFESGKELTPENAREFYTLHPRCGTSFLMFVMVISLIIFSFLGWPNLFWRLTSRILLLPVVAGVSFELLKWAGNSTNIIIEILSIPGIALQKLTTKEPDDSQLEVAIAAMKAVMNEGGNLGQGICNNDGEIIEEDEAFLAKLQAEKEEEDKKAAKKGKNK